MPPPLLFTPVRLGLLAAFAAGLSGCIAPMALDWAVISYDRAATDIASKQLLLNIARAHQHQPFHFTGVSNIAATYAFNANVGATPALTGESGGLLVPIFGVGASENPTISIVPIEGEEFTRRLLTPLQESKLTLLLRQGVDVDLLLRLMVAEFRTERDGEEVAFHNRPSDRKGYGVFRQVMAHLSAIQDRNALYVEPLIFRERWTIPANLVTPEALQSADKDYDVDEDATNHVFRLSNRVTGRIIITNYDPATLPEEERNRINELAEAGPPNEIMVDIRPGHVGGDFPLKGKFRLRSFGDMLDFIGRGIEAEPEFDVAPHPSTPPIRENPVRTLEIVAANRPPRGADLSVELNGRHYAVKPESGYQWNRDAFRLLFQLYQMTMTELPQFGAPSITIAK